MVNCCRASEKHLTVFVQSPRFFHFFQVLFIQLCSTGSWFRPRTIKNMLSVVCRVAGDPHMEVYLSLFPTETRPLMFSFQLLERSIFDFRVVYLTGDFPQISQRSCESVP